MTRCSALPLTSPTLVGEGCQRAAALLRANTTTAGILAAAPGSRAAGRSYDSIFGRDAAICALGLAVSGEAELAATARAGLRTLAFHQAANGQIPKFVRPETGEVDFWYTGCIDANLWWLAAVRLYDVLIPGGMLAEELSPQIGRALRWLQCQEHPQWGLLQQNEASDWADIMPRSGFVLYTNALWYWVKRLYRLPGTETTRRFARQFLRPGSEGAPGHRRVRLMVDYIEEQGHPPELFYSYVNFASWGEEIDVLGNLLAALVGLAGKQESEAMVERLLALGVADPHPVLAVARPIEPGTPRWRPYMERHGQNSPFQYHNGGIWPFVGGFWVLLLASLGRREMAVRELERLASVNALGGWEFNEWLHGRSAERRGMPGQSWNAALLLLASRAVEEPVGLFDNAPCAPAPSWVLEEQG